MILLAASAITGCAVHPGAPTLHESTTYDYTTPGVTKVQDEFVTAATVIHTRRSYEKIRYYEQRNVCRSISSARATPYDVGAIAKERCAIEEIPRERRVHNGWIVKFEYGGIIYEQYMQENPGSVVLVRITNNSIVGVNQ